MSQTIWLKTTFTTQITQKSKNRHTSIRSVNWNVNSVKSSANIKIIKRRPSIGQLEVLTHIREVCSHEF